MSDHPHLTGNMARLFGKLRQRVLDMDADVTQEILKLYVAFKYDSNFLCVIGQAKRLKLNLNMDWETIQDPHGLCRDMRRKGKWGNGDIEVLLEDELQLDPVMDLINQTLNQQMEQEYIR